MRRTWIACMTLAAAVLLGYFAFTLTQQRAYARDVSSDIVAWEPTSEAIVKAIGSPRQDRAGSFRDERHTQFAHLVQSRYRMHTPGMAVGVQFRDDHSIQLMFPARLEPWVSNSIAVQIWQEARAAFGKNYDINLYYTYIGVPRLYIGALHPDVKNPERILITYQYPRSRPF